MTRLLRTAIAAALIIGAGACATRAPLVEAGPGWTAYGYLTPGRSSEPEEIGDFATERECLDAVDGWMSRQVVGNPVSGECLPIDRH